MLHPPRARALPLLGGGLGFGTIHGCPRGATCFDIRLLPIERTSEIHRSPEIGHLSICFGDAWRDRIGRWLQWTPASTTVLRQQPVGAYSVTDTSWFTYTVVSRSKVECYYQFSVGIDTSDWAGDRPSTTVLNCHPLSLRHTCEAAAMPGRPPTDATASAATFGS